MLYFLVSLTMLHTGELFTYTMDLYEEKQSCEIARGQKYEEYQPADNQQYVCVGLPRKDVIENGLY